MTFEEFYLAVLAFAIGYGGPTLAIAVYAWFRRTFRGRND